MSIPTVPLRTPMRDPQGNLTRTWALFFQSLSSGSTPTVAVAVTIDSVPVSF